MTTAGVGLGTVAQLAIESPHFSEHIHDSTTTSDTINQTPLCQTGYVSDGGARHRRLVLKRLQWDDFSLRSDQQR